MDKTYLTNSMHGFNDKSFTDIDAKLRHFFGIYGQLDLAALVMPDFLFL